VRVYDIVQAAKQLNEEQKPLFRMSSGVYGVEQSNGEATNFRRFDKDRSLKGKARKKARREQRRMLNGQ
jgi:hypothetical protein